MPLGYTAVKRGRLHVYSCSLKQHAQKTSQQEGESLKHDGEIALGKGGGGEVTAGVEDCSPFAEAAGGVVTKGVSGSSSHDYDGGKWLRAFKTVGIVASLTPRFTLAR